MTDDEKKLWDRRRLNLRLHITAAGTNATKLSTDQKLSPNTLTKFLNGQTQTLSNRVADLILPQLGLESVSQLDTDDPLSDPKIKLNRLISGMSNAAKHSLFEELSSRFPNLVK